MSWWHLKHAEGMSLHGDSLYVQGALDEELLEDFGGSEGTEG